MTQGSSSRSCSWQRPKMERCGRGFRLSVRGETFAQGLRLPFLGHKCELQFICQQKTSQQSACRLFCIRLAFLFFSRNACNIWDYVTNGASADCSYPQQCLFPYVCTFLQRPWGGLVLGFSWFWVGQICA